MMWWTWSLYFVLCLYSSLCCIVSVSLPNFQWIKILYNCDSWRGLHDTATANCCGSYSPRMMASTEISGVGLAHLLSPRHSSLVPFCTVELTDTGVSSGRAVAHSPQCRHAADGHLATPTVAGLPGLCQKISPTCLQKLAQFNTPAEFTLGY